MAQSGLIHLYYGHGKGKTTAVLGLGLRAAGHGWRVLLVQFLKAAATGELASIGAIEGFTVLRPRVGRALAMRRDGAGRAELRAQHDQLLGAAIEAAEQRRCELLILDEIVAAVNRDLVDRGTLLDFLRHKPAPLEVALTGRDPDDELLALADYVSEVRKVRHPFDRGIPARPGVER